MEPAGDPLSHLYNEIQELYLPLLSDNNGSALHVPDSLRVEFLSQMKKFSRQIVSAIQQVRGDVRLRVPNVRIPDDVKAVKDDFEVPDY